MADGRDVVTLPNVTEQDCWEACATWTKRESRIYGGDKTVVAGWIGLNEINDSLKVLGSGSNSQIIGFNTNLRKVYGTSHCSSSLKARPAFWMVRDCFSRELADQ